MAKHNSYSIKTCFFVFLFQGMVPSSNLSVNIYLYGGVMITCCFCVCSIPSENNIYDTSVFMMSHITPACPVLIKPTVNIIFDQTHQWAGMGIQQVLTAN